MKVGEIWKPKFKTSENSNLGKVVIVRLEVGTIMAGENEKHNPNAEYVCFDYIDSKWESGCERNEFTKRYVRDYEG